MEDLEKFFELGYRNGTIKIQKHHISGQIVFRIIFQGNNQPLIITRSSLPDKTIRWTSIPEGRQKEAEEIGLMIEDYIRNNQ